MPSLLPYVISVIFAAAMLVVPRPALSDVIIQDNFDSGYTIIDNHSNMSALNTEFVAKGWDGIWWDNSSYLEISSVRSYSGSYSLLHHFDADQDRATLFSASLGATRTLFVRYRLYLESDYWMGWSTTGGEQKWSRYFDTEGHTGFVIASQHLYPNGRGYGSGVRMEWELCNHAAGSNYQIFADYDFSANRGKWLLVELLFVLNTPGQSNGTMMMWVDGVQINLYNADGNLMDNNGFTLIDSTDRKFNSMWFMSLNNGTPNPTQDMWVDDLYISNSNDHESSTPSRKLNNVTGNRVSLH
jgi:hypothetical protein